MSRLVHLLICAFAVVAIPGVAQAARVTIYLDTFGPGGLFGQPADTWLISASVSQGDNDGIAGYNIRLAGGDTAISGGPHALKSSNSQAMGFTVHNQDFNGNGALFGGQNSTEANSLIYGIGQTPWANLFEFTPGSELASDGTPTIPYGIDPISGQTKPEGTVLLGWGTGDWQRVNILESVTNVNVWSAG